jgi:hypothetical protein
VPLKNESGEEIGERMDNLIHASASDTEAEREIKLWCKPQDIPPNMRVYPTRWSDNHYYYKDNQVFSEHEPGSVCLLAPSDVGWESDLEALDMIQEGRPAHCTVQAVAAKYLLNRKVSLDW